MTGGAAVAVLTRLALPQQNVDREQAIVAFNMDHPLPIVADVKVELFDVPVLGGEVCHSGARASDAVLMHGRNTTACVAVAAQKRLCVLWFNTFFISDNRLFLTKSEIDKAAKDKHHKVRPGVRPSRRAAAPTPVAVRAVHADF